MSDQDKTRKLRTSDPASEKTRIVPRSNETDDDPVHSPRRDAGKTILVARPASGGGDVEPGDEASEEQLIAGWLVVISGPGRGRFAPIFDGMNSVGRDDDQSTQLDFGDEAVSRSGHVYIAYDYKQRKFFIQHGGKANIVRLNEAPVLQPTELKTGDRVSIGRTVLGFVAFCGSGFDWQEA